MKARSIVLALSLILATGSATVTILATCGDHFTPTTPGPSNLTTWGTQCSGEFGKKHTWDIYWANYNIQGYDVSEPAACFSGGAHICYPCFLTPVWQDTNKNI